MRAAPQAQLGCLLLGMDSWDSFAAIVFKGRAGFGEKREKNEKEGNVGCAEQLNLR